MSVSDPIPESLAEKARWVWAETLRIHQRAPETRIASSLSAVEILCALYYGGVLRFHPRQPLHPDRDRFIASKGHGSIAMYPILADLGFFDRSELTQVGSPGSRLGAIPDPVIPGYETVNGSLGHGPGVACGMALALRRRRQTPAVFTLVGDGELYEGAVWEAIMFAAQHELDNLTMIVDCNRISMLGHTDRIVRHFDLRAKFLAFQWEVEEVDGHDVVALYRVLSDLKCRRNAKPKLLIAHTRKGHGVAGMEDVPLCHVMSLSSERIDELLR